MRHRDPGRDDAHLFTLHFLLCAVRANLCDGVANRGFFLTRTGVCPGRGGVSASPLGGKKIDWAQLSKNPGSTERISAFGGVWESLKEYSPAIVRVSGASPIHSAACSGLFVICILPFFQMNQQGPIF